MFAVIMFPITLCGIILVTIAKIKSEERHRWYLLYYNQVEISFDQFLSFWRINPSRWRLAENSLEYCCPARRGYPIVTRHISICLPYKDIPRYKKFFANKREQDELAKRNKITTDFIRYVQEDLNKFAAQSPVFDARNSENPMDAVKTSPLPRGFE